MSLSSKRGLRAIRNALLVAASAPLALSASANAETAATDGSVRFGSWGVDLASRDSKANPGDDFERFASGAWMDATEIPADKPSNSVGSEVNDRNQDRLQKIVTSSSKDSQLGALYSSWMDEARLEQLDAAPLKADLDEISAIKTKAQFTSKMVDSFSDFGSTLFALGVLPDPANPTINIAFAGTSGLGLPDRDYYLLDKYKPQRDAYRAYIQRTLELTQTPNASAAADTILAFETEIAKLSWTQADLRNLDKLNNPMTPAELAAYAPGIDWNRYLAELKISTPKIVVGDNTAVKALAALYDATPLETLKLWQRFKVTNQASDYLSKRFVDNKFQFTKTLTGASTLRPRWRRGIDQIDGRLGEVLGQTYVQQYFSPQSKAMMEQLVTNLKAAAAIRIKGNSWMEDATKQAALAKLDRMDVMVGYPDKFRDYSKLEMKADDLYGNVKRSSAFEWDYTLSDLNQPVDRKKWAMSPATVNAYNGGLENKIVFPAGILQPPYFDPQADAAVNYGAIGAVIGHEIMHGFDDQGRKIDASGAIRDWWTPADGERFKKLTDELGKQYASYEAAPGVFINPDLTMGENIGDMSGLEVAYEAYKISLGGKPSPVIDGLTGDQRFFLAFAQAWRGEQRPDAIKTQVASDPHSPRRYRVIGPLRNLDAWYAAFNVQPGTKFYIPPEKRVRIW
ncbi:M13 family metallopeptidase [Sphingomonas sp. NSE70-1]|uniref:M13 family metallopeptidase n=1 Tax=Sphingomonas caseinilyticus TaxID=2908205 RepID=A0ABT0RX52_9SPHN|nr:M13 family metallopeptidase [Sphingomonas caseinilyticus]MCL6699580.1 M13 family metallopeptidase [Sphingomonas caseinilyticus]